MKKHLFSAVAGLALLSVPALAHANDRGWYIRGDAGYGSVTDTNFTNDLIGASQGEGNGALGLGLGYDFGNNWRVEFNADQLWNDLGALNPAHGSTADIRMNNFMLDAIYDFSDFGDWTPFVGAGIGLNNSKLRAAAHNVSVPGTVNACIGHDACTFSSVDSALAWNLLAGVGRRLGDHLTWETQYRYTNVGGLDFNGIGRDLLPPVSLGNFGPHQDIGTRATGVGSHVLLTGLRYNFGARAPKVEPTYTCWDGSSVKDMASCPVEPPKPELQACWDGSMVENLSTCPAKPEPVKTYSCWDGSVVSDLSSCPAKPQPKTYSCWDGSIVTDLSTCPADTRTWHTCADGSRVSDAAFCQTSTPVISGYNNCGVNSVAIFNVPAGKTPKSINRLGTLPEFGDSHGLTPSQFYEKLAKKYKENSFDRAYLNYLFKSMGYANGFKDAHAGLFSEEVLPVGTSGILGLGKKHHYAYSVLNTSEHDRQAFRIQSANGAAVYFMKTCGNYMYPCN